MRLPFLLLVLLLLSHARADEIEIVGEIGAGDQRTLSFVSNGTEQTEWVKLGGRYRGYRFTAYDTERKTARLEKKGQTLDVRWRDQPVPGASPGSTSLSPEEQDRIHQQVVNNLRQLSAAAEQYYLENGKSSATYDVLVGADKYIKRLDPVDGEDYRQVKLAQGEPLGVTTAHGDTVTWAP